MQVEPVSVAPNMLVAGDTYVLSADPNVRYAVIYADDPGATPWIPANTTAAYCLNTGKLVLRPWTDGSVLKVTSIVS